MNHERGSWGFQDKLAVPRPKAGSCYVLLTGLKNWVSCSEDQSSRVTAEAESSITLPSPTPSSLMVSSCWGQDSSKVLDVSDQLTQEEVGRKEEESDPTQEGIEFNGERELEKVGREVNSDSVLPTPTIQLELQLQFQPLQEHENTQAKMIMTETIQQEWGDNRLKCPTSSILLCEQVPDNNLLYCPGIMCHHCQKEFFNFNRLNTHIKKKHLGKCKICQVMDQVQESYEAKLGETSSITEYSSNIFDRVAENSNKYSDDKLERKKIEDDIVEERIEVKR